MALREGLVACGPGLFEVAKGLADFKRASCSARCAQELGALQRSPACFNKVIGLTDCLLVCSKL